MAIPRVLKTLAAPVSACVFATVLAAQSAPNPVLINPKPAPAQAQKEPEAPRTSRVISPEVAAQLQAFAPKYTPPPPKPAPKPEEEDVDAREVDKPRNGIIRLPKMLVQEPKMPVFNERAISTEKGIRDIAVRRYISEVDRAMNRFHIPFITQSLEERAMAMYREDERLKNITDTKDMANTVSKGDAAQGAYIRKESQKTFMRTSDFGWNNGK
jgi:hypothetical protein